MDQKEENEEVIVIKCDCHSKSSLYDTYEVVAIGNKMESHVMKFQLFGSSRRLSSSMASASNAGSSSREFARMHATSAKRTMSTKVTTVMTKFWIKIVVKCEEEA